MLARIFFVLALAGAALLPRAGLAQDPVALYPENDRVRVIDFQLKRGATEEEHHHRQHGVYVLQGFEIRPCCSARRSRMPPRTSVTPTRTASWSS